MTNSKGLFFAFTFLSIVFLSSCGGGNVMLDNPNTQDAATFVIDGTEEYNLQPGEMKKISLSEGSHKVVAKGEKAGPLFESEINVKEGGVIHAGGNYVVWRQLYGVQTDRKSLLNEDWVMIDSTKFLGDLKLYPDSISYIEKNWTLGLDEEMPETQALYITKDYKVESKIFRQADFIATYRALAEQAQKPK
ncbi:MAG: hypothetical protein RLZZ519_3193 [Bacteroidota bacterium]